MKRILTILIVIGIGAMIVWTAMDFIGTNDKAKDDDNGAIISSDPTLNHDNTATTEGTDEVGLEAGMVPPNFELETLEGETVRLSDYKGQKVILNFWATWCPPCREEIPDFNKIYENEDVEILAVNMEETKNNLEMVEEFVEEFEMPFPVLKDEDGELMEAYKVIAFPTSYMIDSEGHIQFVAKGAMTYDQIEERLANMD